MRKMLRLFLVCINKVLGVFSFELRRKNPPKKTFSQVWEHLMKYAPVLDSVPELKTEAPDCEPVRKIWQFWWQGVENAPPIVVRCLESVRRHCAGYEIVVLDKNNFRDYVDIPERVLGILENGGMCISHLSDYIRIELLAKYGGIWLDALTFLTDSLPRDIARSRFFAFSLPYWLLLGDVPSVRLFCALERGAFPNNNGLACNSGVIVARPGSRIILAVKALQEAYWKNEDFVVEYLYIQYFMTMAILLNERCKQEYRTMPKHDVMRTNLLRFSLSEPYDEMFVSEAIKLSPLHKTTYKVADCSADSVYNKIVLGGIC